MTAPRAAIAGAGIIGASWAIVFARAGWQVAVYERNEDRRATLPARIEQAAARAQAVAPDVAIATLMARITVCATLAEALAGAQWVQECASESLPVKAALFAGMDALAEPGALLASSTSSFGISRFAAGLPGRARCLVVHPATPPHLMPVVEVVGAPFTPQALIDRAFAVMRDVGQVPVLVRRETPGFVMNRLQGALLIEMFRTISEGLMSPEDVDRLIGDGFGLRWAFMGPLAGIDLNAPGGIADYLGRYGFIFDGMAQEAGATDKVVTPELVAMLDSARRAALPLTDLPARTAWRDARIAALRALRTELDPP